MRICPGGSSPTRSCRRSRSLSNDEEREDVHRELLAASQSESRIRLRTSIAKSTYARIAYANEHFAAGKPGWKTRPRPHLYCIRQTRQYRLAPERWQVMDRPMEEGGGNTSTYPFEVWHYRYLEGIGDNVDIEFVDTCMCGDYHYDDRPFREGRSEVCAGRRPYDVGAAGTCRRKRTASQAEGLEQLGNGAGTSRTKASSSIDLTALRS